MKQSHLNGAYYGPAIPPPTPPITYYRPRRSRGGDSCCCNPFTCCCSCIANLICTCIFQILCTILVLVGIIIFVLWLIFRPNAVRFTASDAVLTGFNLNNNNTLQYNLALNLTIQNTNSRIGIYYDQIEASAFYQGQRFATVEISPFYQGQGVITNVTAQFDGETTVLLGGDGLSNYDSDRNSGNFRIDVQLQIRSRLRFWIVRSMSFRPRIDCNLDIPFTSNATGAAAFRSQRCGFVWR